MKSKTIFLIFFSLIYFNNLFSQVTILDGILECNGDYELVWQDEFNGSSLDQTLWKTETDSPSPYDRIPPRLGECDWTNAAIFLPQNVNVGGGRLNLTTLNQNFNYQGIAGEGPYPAACGEDLGCDFVACEPFEVQLDHTTGMVKSYEGFRYGIFEVRCKIPSGTGFWPSFWLWGGDEIDVFEFFGETDEQCTDYHRNGDHHNICHDEVDDYSDAFHIYTVEWTPYELKWYFDGALIREEYKFYSINGQETGLGCGDNAAFGLYPRNPLFPADDGWMAIYLTGGIHPGTPPDMSTNFPAVFQIDYARVYQRLEDPSSDENLCHYEIEGEDLICGENTFTYSLNSNVPAQEVVWTTSNNLEIISFDNEEVVVKMVNNGYTNGWIKAEIPGIAEYCSSSIFTKNIQVGINIEGEYSDGNSTKVLNTVNFISTAAVDVHLTTSGISNFNWTLVSGNAFILLYNGGRDASIDMPQGGSATFTISGSSECGESIRTVTFVSSFGFFKLSSNPTISHFKLDAIPSFTYSTTDEDGFSNSVTINPKINVVQIFQGNSGELMSEYYFNNGEKEVVLNVADLNSGNYIIKITDNYNQVTVSKNLIKI